MSNNNASFLYSLTDGIADLRKNMGTNFMASLTVAFSLAIVAVFLILFVNLNKVINMWGEKTQIVVYVGDKYIKRGEKSLHDSLFSIKGIKDAKYVSKEKAFENFKKDLKGNEGILEGIKKNPLPASFELGLREEYRTPERVEEIVKKIKRRDFVTDVQYGAQWVKKFSAFLNFIEFAAVTVCAFVGMAVLFIISNTVRLAVYARREEIEVLRLLGADERFIKTPFIMEGMVQGGLGGLLSLLFLYVGSIVFSNKVPAYMAFVVENPFTPMALTSMLFFSGSLLGFLASYISTGRFIK